MPFALFALAMINVAVGTQGFAFAGVLADIAKDLGISIGQAGFIVGASSITFAIGAPLAASLVAHVERRRVILASLVGTSNYSCFSSVGKSVMSLAVIAAMGADMAGQPGFFDVDRRLEAISAKGDPLETIDRAVPWESLRPEIEAATVTRAEEKKSNAGRPTTRS
jgi:hypothetical protein